MTKPIQGTCDKCHKVTEITFKTNKHSNGIHETYFICKQCGERYTSFVTNDKVRMLQVKKARLTGDRYISDRLKLQDEINELMAKLKSEFVIQHE